jgi:hypothetical protein
MATDPFANYDAWLASPYSEGVTGQVEDDYDTYVDAFWEREKVAYQSAMEDPKHYDYVSWDQWRANAEDDLMDYEDFYDGWYERKEEEAREAYFESRYPDARM